jgi:hypothetical protein
MHLTFILRKHNTPQLKQTPQGMKEIIILTIAIFVLIFIKLDDDVDYSEIPAELKN